MYARVCKELPRGKIVRMPPPWQWLQQDGALVPSLLLLLSLLVLLITLRRSKGTSSTTSHRRLPPSPPKLPVIGNLHRLVGHPPHRSLTALSQEYGPLMLLQLGQVSAVVVSSADMLEEMMKTNDAAVANRPESELVREFSKKKDSVFSSHGDEYWKNVRRLFNHHVMGASKVQSYKSIREEEVALMAETIKQTLSSSSSSSSGGVVDLGKISHDFVIDFFSRVVHGRRFREEGLHGMFSELMEEYIALISQIININDCFPSLPWLSKLRGFDAQVRRVSLKWDHLIDCMIKNHLNRAAGNGEFIHQETILDVLLTLLNNTSADFPITMENIKPIMIELLTTGTNSPAHTLEWAMAELIHTSRVMRRAQSEIRMVAGAKAAVDEEDIAQMNYLKAVVKETLRLHPPAAVFVPRQSSKDICVGGYEILKQTWVIINAWAIMRDAKFWDAPEEFRPERFLDANMDFKGADFKFIPFGFGRRFCPGLQFATSIIELALANLLHQFDWELPDGMQGDDLDMEEIYRFPMRKKHTLCLIPKPRAHDLAPASLIN